MTNLQLAEKLESLAREILTMPLCKSQAWEDDLIAMADDLYRKAIAIDERTITPREAELLKCKLAKTNIDPRALLKKYHCTRWGTMQIQHWREAMDNLEAINPTRR